MVAVAPGGSPGTAQHKSGGISGTAILLEVQKFMGTPYVWGGSQPGGFDCSGLVQYTLTQLGVKNVPRTSEAQWAWVRKIPASQVQPGDLVFFTGADGASPGHVGIVSESGTHWTMVDAPYTGVDVRQDSFSVPGSGEMRVIGFGRPPGVAGGGVSANIGPGQFKGGGVFSLSLPGPVGQFFTDAENFAHAAMWWVNPENQLRVIAGVFGGLLLIAGVLVFARAGG
ncbi:MAG TPA: NlpC/P60 family protein [Streptosporangiaceae bacterium]